MPPQVISRDTAQHYIWGNNCDGWFLVCTPELNIIEERMPPATSESRHHHLYARQFFFVLEGELTMEIEGQVFTLRQAEGIEIAPGEAHQAMNRSGRAVRFLVTSHPQSHRDRVDSKAAPSKTT